MPDSPLLAATASGGKGGPSGKSTLSPFSTDLNTLNGKSTPSSTQIVRQSAAKYHPIPEFIAQTSRHGRGTDTWVHRYRSGLHLRRACTAGVSRWRATFFGSGSALVADRAAGSGIDMAPGRQRIDWLPRNPPSAIPQRVRRNRWRKGSASYTPSV